MFALLSSGVGLPERPAVGLAPVDEPQSYCGSPEMDDYFNERSSGSVAAIVSECCDEQPAPEKCDTHRLACINYHVTSGACFDADDCDAGCEFFNSVVASCCPHVRKAIAQESVAMVGEAEKDSVPLCVSTRPAVTDDWCVATCDPKCSPEAQDFCKCGKEAKEFQKEKEKNAAQGREENGAPKVPEATCYSPANDKYYNDLAGGMLANITTTCCGYAPVWTAESAQQFPEVCGDYLRLCNKAQVAKGVCDDETDCDMGLQVLNQIIDSCCHRPMPPPAPSPPVRLCASVDSESDAVNKDLATLFQSGTPGRPHKRGRPERPAKKKDREEAEQVWGCVTFKGKSWGDDTWCKDNCAQDWCPSDTCECDEAMNDEDREAAAAARTSPPPLPPSPPPPKPTGMLADGEDCYEACGKQGGFCSLCGESRACCHSSGSYPSDPKECNGLTHDTTWDGNMYHACVDVKDAKDYGNATSHGYDPSKISHGPEKKQDGKGDKTEIVCKSISEKSSDWWCSSNCLGRGKLPVEPHDQKGDGARPSGKKKDQEACPKDLCECGESSVVDAPERAEDGAIEGGTPPQNVSADRIRNIYNHGKPSNNLSEVGLLVHCFDGTEDHDAAWKPCTEGGCNQFQWWWSASIINQVQHDLLGTAGIILHPKYAKVECSWDTDMGSMNSGCGDKDNLEGLTEKDPWGPDHLKDMLEISMQQDNAQHKAGAALGIPVYNEVIVNSSYFIKHLPGSIAAVVYFEDHDAEPKTNAGGVLGKDTRMADKIAANEAYIALLDHYKLNETNIPLLVMSREGEAGAERAHVVDVSSGARRLIERYRKDNPAPRRKGGHPRQPEFPREKFDREVGRINAEAEEARREEEAVARPAPAQMS